jgi:hypothetical protein
MKMFIRDLKTNKKYLIKGISCKQYQTGEYSESELFEKIYQLLIKHDIQESELINDKGQRVDV